MSKKDSSIQIGRKVQYLREQLGLSQSQMASNLGVSTRAVHKWEQGLIDFPSSTIFALAGELKVDPGELYSPAPQGWQSQAERRSGEKEST